MKVNISIIIPNYNQSIYLEECINSVLSQSLQPLEIIIVDDKSTDDSIMVIEQIRAKNECVRLIALEKNRGVSYARNVGLRQAQGELVSFLDADDFYFNTDKLKNEIEAGGGDFDFKQIVYSPIVLVDKNSKVTGSQLKSGKGKFLERNIELELIAQFKPSRPPRDYIVSKNLLLAVGGYCENRNLYEDYELLIRLSKHASFKCTYQIGTAYRVKPGGLSDQKAEILFNTKKNICHEYYFELTKIRKAKVLLLVIIQRLYDFTKKSGRN